MRVLVTGSSGFIGQHLVRVLVAKGYEVTGLDRSNTATVTTVAPLELCDVLDQERVRAVMTRVQPDAVVHLAARTDLAETRSLRGYAANVDGVRNLINAIRATRSVRRAIFTSSQLVCRIGYVPSSTTDYAPDTVYGESKVMTERIVRAEEGGGVVWCLVRPTTVWGPGMSAHYQRFLRMIAKGRYFHVSRRPLLKSYGYIGNIVHQYERLLSAPPDLIQRKTLYLADEPPLSLRAWADAIQEELAAPPIRTLPESVARLLAKMGDMVNALGFKAFPFNSFRLRNMLTEYRFDLSETIRICGPSPFSEKDGVRELAAWFRSIQV